ncbi:MAG: long-chain fatty acid--CoA ligase [Nitrospirae bacterium]|nr:long-chain fatty acid--CoA ligase [Nitrospirota bacterium]
MALARMIFAQVWLCGACAVPIPVELVPEEKHRIFGDIRLDTVISPVETINIADPYRKGEPIYVFGNIAAVPVKNAREHPAGFSKINAAFLRFTSGTTGDSKGVVLSHETIYDRINAANEVLCINPEDKIVWLLSMSYHFAVSIVAYLTFGATIVLCRNHLGSTVIQAALQHNGSIIYGSPVHYEMMAYDRSSLMMPDIRLVISTTAALRNEISNKFYDRFNIPLVNTYGIIEVGLPCINLWPLGKESSVGQVLPSYEISMEDMGLGDGHKAIKFRGKGFIDAYYDPWQTRSEIMTDGWFTTGDLGMVDHEGYLFILGRSKEMINVGGMKFFPREVEAILESHPSVREAYVFAVKHAMFGEIPNANVVMNKGFEDSFSGAQLQAFCRSHAALYKVPEKIEVVDILPRTASGKLIRRKTA